MNLPKNVSESQLVASLKKGSVRAFNMIYQLYAKDLLTYVASATKNKEDAEEIVHDIFLGLWNNRINIDTDTNLSTFLFHIAYKRRIDLFRRSLTVPIYEDYMLFKNELISEENNDLEYDDFNHLITAALQSLPLRLQNILTLSRISGLSNQQIAAKLNISPKTVRNSLSLGLKLLKDKLDDLRKNNKI